MTVCANCQAENEDAAENCFTCGQRLSVVITRGRVIASRYEVLEFLGRGGMGAVYLAHDRELDEKVAIKVLRTDLARSEEMAKRFRHEIKLARKVRHKNVCAIHEFGDERGLRFIAMEYVEGIDLREVLRQRGSLPLDEAVAITIQIGEGLRAIHEVGIVHRDLKSPNVMLDARGWVRLMDFGIAKQVESQTRATATGMIVGTPEYMSPEQIRAEKIDGRSDLYALGILFFELLTGDVPFRGDTPVAVLMKHLHEPAQLDGPALAAAPVPVRELLARMLAKDPDERLPSADDAVRALREVQAALRPGRGLGVGPPLAVEGVLAHVPLRATAPAATTPMLPETEAPAVAPAGTTAVRAGTGAKWLALSGAVVVGGVFVVMRALTGGWPPAAGPSPPSPRGTIVAPSPAEAASPVTTAAVRPPPTPTPAPATREPRQPGSTLPQAKRLAGASPMPALSSPELASPEPPLSPVSQLRETGLLRIVAIPWAQVLVDGVAKGTTPFPSLSLPAGTHVVVLKHPAYEVLERRVSIRPAETEVLRVDFETEGVARQR